MGNPGDFPCLRSSPAKRTLTVMPPRTATNPGVKRVWQVIVRIGNLRLTKKTHGQAVRNAANGNLLRFSDELSLAHQSENSAERAEHSLYLSASGIFRGGLDIFEQLGEIRRTQPYLDGRTRMKKQGSRNSLQNRIISRCGGS
jgi:hypothetical protein